MQISYFRSLGITSHPKSWKNKNNQPEAKPNRYPAVFAQIRVHSHLEDPFLTFVLHGQRLLVRIHPPYIIYLAIEQTNCPESIEQKQKIHDHAGTTDQRTKPLKINQMAWDGSMFPLREKIWKQ